MSACSPLCGYCGACTEAWEREFDDELDDDYEPEGDDESAPLERTDDADL